MLLLLQALASIRCCCIPVMSHDNDNARNFTAAAAAPAAAAAAYGTTAVTPLISRPLLVIPGKIGRNQRTEIKDGTPDYAADLKITVAAVAARCCRRRRRRLPFMIKGAHLSESYLVQCCEVIEIQVIEIHI